MLSERTTLETEVAALRASVPLLYVEVERLEAEAEQFEAEAETSDRALQDAFLAAEAAKKAAQQALLSENNTAEKRAARAAVRATRAATIAANRATRATMATKRATATTARATATTARDTAALKHIEAVNLRATVPFTTAAQVTAYNAAHTAALGAVAKTAAALAATAAVTKATELRTAAATVRTTAATAAATALTARASAGAFLNSSTTAFANALSKDNLAEEAAASAAASEASAELAEANSDLAEERAAGVSEAADAAIELADSNEAAADLAFMFGGASASSVAVAKSVPDFAFLHNSNLEEDDYPRWLKTETYARGDFAVSLETHRIYRSLNDNNTNNDPDVEQVALDDPLQDDPDPINWQIISATNLWKLFDRKPSIQCRNDNLIKVTLSASELATGLGFFNLSASYITVTVNQVLSNGALNQVYDKPHDLIDNSAVVDMLSYYTAPIINLDAAVVLDLPVFYPNSFIEITIHNPGLVAACGQIVIGDKVDMGFARVGSSGFRGLDFSSVIMDPYGNLDTVKRQASKVATFDVVVPTVQLSSLDAILRALRGGEPIVWIPDEDSRKAGLIYGFYRDYGVTYSTGGRSYLNLEIQGVV